MKQLKLTKPWIGKAEHDAVYEVLDSGWLAEGKVTREFEKKVAEYVGVKHAVALSNCTVALELCLRALNVTGKVQVPAFGHPATVQAIKNAGATPVFSDVSLDTYNIVGIISTKYDAVMPVSWGGNPLLPLAYSGDLEPQVVEDAACSLGAEYADIKTGCGINHTCFSFHPRKLVTTGEGGMVTTNDAFLAKKLRSHKNFGRGNYKLNDVASALGLAQMGHIETIIDRRVEMAGIYTELLKGTRVLTPRTSPHTRHTYQTYAVYLQDVKRDENHIIDHLAKQGIETQVGAYALHKLFPEVQHVEPLHNSLMLDRNLLALPMSYDMTDEDQHRVVDALKRELA